VVIRALVESRIRGEPFSLLAAKEDHEKPPGFDQKLDELLRGAVQDDAGRRAADRLRAQVAR
jgi:hypothetical protein